ncbi:hypothetical protein PC120_g18847 [Phytophthora cactorum]|nr:hypothetical protein PC120_g18847 [Phytophthora cactorum]
MYLNYCFWGGKASRLETLYVGRASRSDILVVLRVLRPWLNKFGAVTISGEDDGGGGGVVANKEEARSPVPGEEEGPRKRLGVVVHGDDGEEAKTVLAAAAGVVHTLVEAAVGVFRVVILGVRDTWRYVCCPEVVCLKRRNLL